MKKVDKKLIKILKPVWLHVQDAQDAYWDYINTIEEYMQSITGIEDLEVFHCDGAPAGIGNSSRTMSLIHAEELEK